VIFMAQAVVVRDELMGALVDLLSEYAKR